MKRCECDDNAAFGLPSAVLSDDSDQQSNWVIGDCAGSSVCETVNEWMLSGYMYFFFH